MTEIELLPICNQIFSETLNGHNFDFTFRTYRGLLFVSVTIDKTHVVAGRKALPSVDILPAEYAAMVGGNFRFETVDGEYPHFELFDGTRCRFYFTGEG